MNKMMMCVLAVAMVGCHSQTVLYSHKDGTDWLTMESRGDNLADHAKLTKHGEEMCATRGKKLGVDVIYSAPGGSMNGNAFSSYTIAYKCKEPESHVVAEAKETAKEWYGKAEKKFNEIREKLQASDK